MKIDEFLEKYKKEMTVVAGIAVLLLLVTAGNFFFLSGKGPEEVLPSEEERDAAELYEEGDVLMTEGIVGASMVQEKLAVEGLSEGLFVEEIFVEAGDEVKEGERIMRFSEESVELARRELEQKVRAAELEFRAGELAYEKSRITLRYDKERAVLEGELAQEVYEDTTAALAAEKEKAQAALDDAKARIKECEKLINESNAAVESYQKIYDDNLKALTKKIDQYGFSWEQVVNGSQTAAVSEQLAVAQRFYKVLEQNLEDYEQAKAEREESVANAKLERQTLELSLSALETELSEAKASYETSVLEAGLVRDQKKEDAERAQSDYVAKLDKAQAEYESLQCAKEEAEETLKQFERLAANGYYYAKEAGTVLQMAVAAEESLQGGNVLFEYSTPTKRAVMTTVGQSDIAAIAVGDTAYIKSREKGSFQGIVVKKNPIPEMDRNGDMVYRITLQIEGEEKLPKVDETVTVMFRIGGSADEQAE